MERLLRREYGLSKRSKRGIAAILVLFLLTSALLLYALYNKVEDEVMTDAVRSLTNISELNAETVGNSLRNRLKLLECIGGNLTNPERMTDYAFLAEKLRIYLDNYGFAGMGILLPDGTLYTAFGDQYNMAGYPPYEDAIASREPRISTSYQPFVEGDRRLNLMTAPVFGADGELLFLILAASRSADLAQRMNISALEGNAMCFLINTAGELVIYPRNMEDELYTRLARHINDRPYISPTRSETDNYSFTFEQEAYFAHFEPLEINDWFLMTVAREKDVFAGANATLRSVIVSMGILWLELLAALGFIMALVDRFQAKVQRAVYEDKLLKEPNSEYLALYYPQIPKEKRGAMAFAAMDVDKFKEFNFLYGNEEGDKLLRYISRVFKEELPGDQIFRYTADHFGALVVGHTPAQVEEKINSLRVRFAQDIEQGSVPPFDLSVGVRMMAGDEKLQTVYSDALIAKNTVKGNHVQKYALYGSYMRQERIQHMEMESDFAKALRAGEFKVYYQPKVDMRTGQIVGAEALTRWIRADGRMVSPGAFIPCFEASRQIVMLDEEVLRLVCCQMKAMEREGLPVQPVSVNLSRVHLRHRGITEKIARIIKDNHIDPSKLAFEITESALYGENIPMQEIVSQLHDLGCAVNMDDYGAGLSGPRALANIAFDVVKVDKSFIDKIGDGKVEAVIRSTISLSQNLGMSIIAEGVEEAWQAEWLVQNGCHFAQGYHYAKPVPEDVYREMLREGVVLK